MANLFDNWQDSFGKGLRDGQMLNQMQVQNQQLEQQKALQRLQMEDLKEKVKEHQRTITEAERLNGMVDDPQYQELFKNPAAKAAWATKEGRTAILGNMFKPQTMNEAQILSLPDNNPLKVNYLSGKKSMSTGQAKPLNMEVAYDTLGASYFPDYAINPESQKQFNVLFNQKMSTPEGRKELLDRRQSITPPSITYLQTNEGIIPAVTRGQGVGTVGQPTGLSKPMPSEMITAEQQIGTLLDTSKAMKDVYKPEYVGPVAGRYGGLKEQTVGLDENQALFRARVAQMNNSLIYLMSGKQINESEYYRLKKQMPDVNLPSPVFEARMSEFERTVKSIIDNRRKNMKAYGAYTTKSNNRPPLDYFDR